MSWLVVLVISLVGLGHVCELPLTELMAHAAGAAHSHDADHHAAGEQVACDAVEATKTMASPAELAPPDVGVIVADTSASPRRARLALGASPPPLVGPPLFLRHASLLI